MSERKKAQIGIYGLGAMGMNLARNFARNGYKVAVSNRTVSKAYDFLDDLRAENIAEVDNLIVSDNLKEMVADVKKGPIILLISSGDPQEDLINGSSTTPIDDVIFHGSISKKQDGTEDEVAALVELVSEDHVIIDAGNSHPYGTSLRDLRLAKMGIKFLGMGVSGGEMGALMGPSIMPGGAKSTYESVEEMLKAAAAKKGETVCCEWMGPAGAGHLVKIVHNGIEYAIMAAIAETYWLLKQLLNLSDNELHELFKKWNSGKFESYLLEITQQIFSEESGNSQVLNKILDSAGAKGTGKWTVQIASDLGVPAGAIYSALELRKLSNNKDLRVNLNKKYKKMVEEVGLSKDKNKIIDNAKKALYASILVAYIQGYEVIGAASRDLQYTKPHQGLKASELAGYDSEDLVTHVDLVEVSKVWKAGCIIRSNLLEVFEEIFETNKSDEKFTLLESPEIIEMLSGYRASWSSSVELANKYNVPYQTIGSSLNYLHSITAASLPANLIQAQRDLFGAHTFKRKDKEGTFHHYWGDEYSVTADFKK